MSDATPSGGPAERPAHPANLNLGELEQMPAEDLVKWTFATYGARAAIGTSLQLTGSVLVDLAAKAGIPFRVFLIDTLRLHPESYELIEKVEAKYGIRIERYTPNPDRLAKMIRQHGEYLFFDTKAKQEYCCQVRKVEPNEEAVATLDAWITGLRRDQSEARATTPRVSFTMRNGRELLRLAPLADWTEDRVREYIQANGVPSHPLFDRGYDSIGCIICTTPVMEHEPKRAGRWRWFNHLEDNKECGIHLEKGTGI